MTRHPPLRLPPTGSDGKLPPDPRQVARENARQTSDTQMYSQGALGTPGRGPGPVHLQLAPLPEQQHSKLV